MLLGGVGLSSPYPSSKSSKDNYSQFLHFLGLIGLILMLERPRWHKKAHLIAEKGFNFGRGDRIASPSSCFPGGTPFLKTLRQTCLLAGSHLWRPATKKPFSQARRASILVGATGFEPATLCSQSRCASQAAPRPVSKRRRQTITI